MRVRSVVAAGALALTALAPVGAASAMGTGDPYLDLQVGVTYTVYKPTYTAGLKTRSVGPNLAGAPGIEQNLFAKFGTSKGKHFFINEGNPPSSDVGEATLVAQTTVQGQAAKIYAFCDPATKKKCTQQDVAKVGGYLDVTLPAAPNLRPTIVWVESTGGITAKQLIRIANGLKPVQ